MAIEVFNRYEKKYLLDQNTYEAVNAALEKHMILDAYNQQSGFYTICNIYYDTEDDMLIKKSLSKPVYKEKLRLRAYGGADKNSKAYLEIKKKYKGIVNKRRTHITFDEAQAFVETQTPPLIQSYHNRQVIQEINYMLKQYPLIPSVFIAYDRKALFHKESSDLRITFDTNIRTRRDHLSFEYGDGGERLLEEGQWLMEIKAPNVFPVWLTDILTELKVFPTSFSKYGKEFMNHLQTTKQIKGEERQCLIPYSAVQPELQYRLCM